MSCTGWPSFTNLSFAIVKEKFPPAAAAVPVRQQTVATATARAAGILRGEEAYLSLAACMTAPHDMPPNHDQLWL